MITTAAKFWLAVAALAFVGAFLYGFPAGGEWYGSFVLATIAVPIVIYGLMPPLHRLRVRLLRRTARG